MSKVKIDELTIEGVVYVPKGNVVTFTPIAENEICINNLSPEIDKYTWVRKGSLQKVIELNGQESVWEVGKNYLIRTVTMIQLGRLILVTDKELVLSDACWVADTGRFNEALSKGTLNEVEMFQRNVIVSRGAIIDATEWFNLLPQLSK